MKKAFALLLLSAVLICMSATVSATGTVNGGGEGEYYIDASVNFIPGTAADIVSVDVRWDALNFDYHIENVGVWNPDDHSYVGAEAGTWSDNKAGISVTNHSNAQVNVEFGFTPAANVSVNGDFYTKDGEIYTKVTDAKTTLKTAVGTNLAAAPKTEYYFGVSGGTLSENGPLGNITVSVVLIPSIRDMTALRAAIANGGTVMIDGHIGNSDNAETLLIEDLGGDLVLDLGGHTLNAAIVVNDLSDSGYKVTIKNGTLAGNTRDASSYTVENKSGNVFIADCTVARGGGYVTVKNEGKMTMIDCTVLYYDGRDGVAVAAGADSELELRGETDFSGDEGVSIGNINAADGSKVAASPGTYNFDPTQYVDTELYTVTESGGRWTVAERT